MNGRLEYQLKLTSETENILNELPDYVYDWYYYLKANQNSATTCRDYIRKIKNFLQTINTNICNVTLKDITDKSVMLYLDSIRTKKKKVNGKVIQEPTSDSYQQCIWSCLNNFFDYLVAEGKMKYNCLTKLKIKRPKNRDLVRINRERVLLTEKDFNAIIEEANKEKDTYRCKTRDICMLKLFMTTGMRKGALASINIEDIDFEKKTLYIIDKGNVVHNYSLSDSMIECINMWIEDRKRLLGFSNETTALFISKEGNRIALNSIDKVVGKYSSRALGHKISPHKLRSGFVSIVQSKTHDVEFTRRAVGHSNVSTTQRYIVTDNTEKKQASQIIEGIIS